MTLGDLLLLDDTWQATKQD